ncbi:hypothetical protein [Streptomyces sp. NPDC054946]
MIEALRHMKESREINTVRRTDTTGALVVYVEAEPTHEELLQALPVEEPRLVVHELSFATREGARRHEQLLILRISPLRVNIVAVVACAGAGGPGPKTTRTGAFGGVGDGLVGVVGNDDRTRSLGGPQGMCPVPAAAVGTVVGDLAVGHR